MQPKLKRLCGTIKNSKTINIQSVKKFVKMLSCHLPIKAGGQLAGLTGIFFSLILIYNHVIIYSYLDKDDSNFVFVGIWISGVLNVSNIMTILLLVIGINMESSKMLTPYLINAGFLILFHLVFFIGVFFCKTPYTFEYALPAIGYMLMQLQCWKAALELSEEFTEQTRFQNLPQVEAPPPSSSQK